ncbi:ABC transporter ATP-binding protein [Pseudooceanicola sp. LIPI14-2-Ac024]|uniref:ABC transporter ATP-binding protein n=1 Tax=Pseudooceanicola sp. LIPI14-2-Ac024 TaxID=3344875 RepID=UPI0035D01173
MSVNLKGVTKRFGGTVVVSGITTRIEEGEFFVILGPSGCGKSTLLRLIAGLDHPDDGQIDVGGTELSSPSRHVAPEKRGIGVVFQSYALWPHMSVRDNAAFPAEAAGATRAEARRIAEESLALVDLLPYADRAPAALSGGQRQRVALARCLAGGARTVLMDEPLANLDPHLRDRMETEIQRFHRQSGATTIYITHDQREAMSLADRIAVMWDGAFLQVATPQEIHDRPADEKVARFIGRSAVLPGEVAGGMARIGPLCVPVAATDGPARIVIRPGDIRIGDGVPARLENACYRGGVWEAAARIAGLAEALPISAATPLSDGQDIALTVSGGWALPG